MTVSSVFHPGKDCETSLGLRGPTIIFRSSESCSGLFDLGSAPVLCVPISRDRSRPIYTHI